MVVAAVSNTLVRLGVGTEVSVIHLGPRETRNPYFGLCGRIVEELPNGYYKVILDNDPIPRWRDIGIQCKAEELKILED